MMKQKNTLSNSRIRKLMRAAQTPSGPTKDKLRNDTAGWSISMKQNASKTVVSKEKWRVEMIKIGSAIRRKAIKKAAKEKQNETR